MAAAGTLKRFNCCACGVEILRTGGSTGTRCEPCRLDFHGERGIAQLEAHAAVRRAIVAGELDAPALHDCADCGNPAEQYDHRDYTKPLAVDPVCRSCNVRRGPAEVWTAAEVA